MFRVLDPSMSLPHGPPGRAVYQYPLAHLLQPLHRRLRPQGLVLQNTTPAVPRGLSLILGVRGGGWQCDSYSPLGA